MVQITRRQMAVLTASAAAGPLALVGCADGSGPGGSGSDRGGSDQGGSGKTRSVTDIDGKSIEIPKDIARIGDLWHANNQVVLLLGGADRIVATTTAILGLPWFVKVYPKIKDVPAPVQGTDVNMEELLKTDPQVVLASSTDQISAATSAGIPSVHVDFQDFDGLKKVVDITADVIGDEKAHERAKKFNTYLDGNLELVQGRLKDVADGDKPTVLHIVGGDDLTKVDGDESLIGRWMDATGARNSLADAKNMAEVTLEQIIASDPEIIIIGGTKAHQGIDKLTADPAWAGVRAVRDDRVLANPVGTFNWDRYSCEEALQLLWAAQQFHPDKFQDVDLVSETRTFYRDYYDFDLDEDGAKRIIAAEAPAG